MLLPYYPPESRCDGEWKRDNQEVGRLFEMRRQHLPLFQELLYNQEQRRASIGMHVVGRHQRDAN